MGHLRVWRRAKIIPGVTLNLSKSGPSLSFGVRGAHVTVGRRGVRKTVGIPGTGIFYTSLSGHHSGVHTESPGAADLAQNPGTFILAFVVVFVAVVIGAVCAILVMLS